MILLAALYWSIATITSRAELTF